jgi:predicted transcriptional regulator
MAGNNEGAALSEMDLLECGTSIVSAFVSRNPISATGLTELIRGVHEALKSLEEPTAPAPITPKKPAVPISKSVQRDYIVCLEDGKQLTMLKRYLRARYDLSPEEYRRKWGLPPEYPMVAPAYAERRSNFAKQIGLGKGVRRK